MNTLMETNMEYKDLMNLLNKADPKDVYEELIKKEDNVLNTINRVVNHSNEKEIKMQEFTNMSLDDIIHKLFWNLRLITNELYSIKTVQDLGKSLLKDDRKIYIGIMMLLISLFLFFIIISN